MSLPEFVINQTEVFKIYVSIFALLITLVCWYGIGTLIEYYYDIYLSNIHLILLLLICLVVVFVITTMIVSGYIKHAEQLIHIQHRQ